MQFTNQVVLITGASNGIGRQLAVDLSTRGAIVAGCGRSIPRLKKSWSKCAAPVLAPR